MLIILTSYRYYIKKKIVFLLMVEAHNLWLQYAESKILHEQKNIFY